MNGKERDKLAVVANDVRWIKEEVAEIKDSLRILPCKEHMEDMEINKNNIISNREQIKAIKESRIRDFSIFTVIVSVIVFLINILLK